MDIVVCQDQGKRTQQYTSINVIGERLLAMAGAVSAASKPRLFFALCGRTGERQTAVQAAFALCFVQILQNLFGVERPSRVHYSVGADLHGANSRLRPSRVYALFYANAPGRDKPLSKRRLFFASYRYCKTFSEPSGQAAFTIRLVRTCTGRTRASGQAASMLCFMRTAAFRIRLGGLVPRASDTSPNTTRRSCAGPL